MQTQSEKNLYNPYFSHIYVEDNALNYPNTEKILSHFKSSKIININHYKDLFCRNHQNFHEEKNSPSLILAVKKDKLIYKGSSMCDDFGNDNFYYTSSIMNCIYNCEYCYLQGMYPSAHIVIFVNIDDIFKEVEKKLKKSSIYLCVSYDTDILALEQILGYGFKWLSFAKSHTNLKLELRTKSTGFNYINNFKSLDNVIIAWTLSPEPICSKYEHGTPTLKNRLTSIKRAINMGWKIRLCFDPLLYVNDYEEIYVNFLKEAFKEIPSSSICDVSIGVFRVSKDYMKIMRKVNPESILLNFPFETNMGTCSYSIEITNSLISCVYNEVKRYIPEEKIYAL